MDCGMYQAKEHRLFVIHRFSFLQFPLSSSSLSLLFLLPCPPFSQFPNWTTSSLILTHQQLSPKRTKKWRMWMGRIMDNKFVKDRCRHCLYLSLFLLLRDPVRLHVLQASWVSKWRLLGDETGLTWSGAEDRPLALFSSQQYSQFHRVINNNYPTGFAKWPFALQQHAHTQTDT